MKLLSTTLGIAVGLAPRWVLACPMCAGREGAGLSYVAVVFALMLLPFAIAGVVLTVLRRVRGNGPSSDSGTGTHPGSSAL